MSFKKILLASAIAAASTTSFAMEAMDDSAMSATTGQDGLTITLATALSLDMYIHDTDGFGAFTNSGAIGLKGIGMSSDGLGADVGLSIVIDAAADATAVPNDAVLQIGISTTTNTVLDLGSVTVADSNRTTLGGSWGVVALSETSSVLDLGSVEFAATSNLLNIQMGNELQGAWMKVGATFTGGLAINGFALRDTGGALLGGGIGGDLTITDAGGTDLTADLSIDATTSGLVITVDQLGALGGMDVRLAGLKLGDLAGATQVGDIEIIGLNLNGTTITVAGH